MADGLRLISAAIMAGASGQLVGMNEDLFIDNELQVRDFVLQHYRQYRSLPTAATVQQETGVRLPSAPEPLSFYVDRVDDRKLYNDIRERFADLREGMAERDMPRVSTAVREMHSATRATSRRGHNVLSLGQAYELVERRLDTTRGLGGVTGIEVGWPRYDMITGGYQRADLISLVARPSIGKTYLCLKQAWAARQRGHSVLFVTTEMGIEPLARRHASIELGINPTFLRMNMISSHMRRRLRTLAQDMLSMDGFHIFSVGMNAETSAIEGLAQEYMPDFIVVDGSYLLRPGQGRTYPSRSACRASWMT